MTPHPRLRWNTERPITLREHGGASVLVGNAIENLRREYATIRSLTRTPQRPPLWDGKTATRIVETIVSNLSQPSQPALPQSRTQNEMNVEIRPHPPHGL
jgi:hypothetical protein